MKSAVIVFPGSNCDRDLAVAFERASGKKSAMVWHKDVTLPDGLDVIGIPGGFSFGDYLRCGAIAARSPICRAVVDFANRGGHVLGICNGFQVLTETGLLPGALIRIPIAHHDGNYVASDDLAARLKAEGRVAFTYQNNPNGSVADIAGILSENRRVLGMMPHPERLNDAQLGGTDGSLMFRSLIQSFVTA
jgi:phosphoribosylformylglycinamidine synthase subunit PurQ / glutaminase